jgi:hypothetical protein
MRVSTYQADECAPGQCDPCKPGPSARCSDLLMCQRFFSQCDATRLKPVLLVEHNARDLGLTLLALERTRLANVVVVVRDGVQALDFLLRRNDSADRVEGSP